jgi:ribonuclease P protein component
MLARVFRVNKEDDFKKVFKFSKPVFDAYLTLRFIKNQGRISRFGFIVSNKIDKRATKRNELKRKMRAVILSMQPRIKSGYDVVFILSKKMPEPYEYSKIQENLKNILTKASLLYD